MGIWIPALATGFYAPVDAGNKGIFFFEALAVLCALRLLSAFLPNSSRVLIYCDNQNSVHLFSSFAPKPAYNPITRAVVDTLLANNWDLRVRWLSSEDNAVADAVSRADFTRARQLIPSIVFEDFSPP
ncbi:hypothetical protein CONPUDRAFT_36372, partial [Coniophora puteana RWD-64-598 SS2]